MSCRLYAIWFDAGSLRLAGEEVKVFCCWVVVQFGPKLHHKRLLPAAASQRRSADASKRWARARATLITDWSATISSRIG